MGTAIISETRKRSVQRFGTRNESSHLGVVFMLSSILLFNMRERKEQPLPVALFHRVINFKKFKLLLNLFFLEVFVLKAICFCLKSEIL